MHGDVLFRFVSSDAVCRPSVFTMGWSELLFNMAPVCIDEGDTIFIHIWVVAVTVARTKRFFYLITG